MGSATGKNVVLFPFPGQGHFAAFLSFAGVLRRALPDDVAITLVSTPGNVATLRRRASSGAAQECPFLAFRELPFVPADHGLPPGCESADGIPPIRIIELLEAFETLQPAFDDFIAGAGDVVCVVSDPFVAWTVAVARRRGCAHAFFASCGAFGSAVVHSLWSRLPVRPDAAGRDLLPEHPDVVIDRSQVPSYSIRDDATAGDDPAAAFFGRQIPLGYQTDTVLINTVEEFEPTGLAMLRRALKLPVFAIGPLVRASSGPISPGTDTAAAVVSFLDSHPPSSVLYISFGSQISIRAEHMAELAAALETTGRPFVWAAKPPDGHDIKGAIRPEWLEERVTATKKGLVLHGWAPQVSILAHPSTGAFLSHCGWNSVLESVTRGVPIIGWPLAGEQFYNAKMLDEEWGVCVEAARGNAEGAAVEKGALAAAVETVMGPTAKAAEMRRRAGVIKAIMEAAREEGDGSSARKALEESFKAMKLK
uniref:Glycosyltransferase n=1 Tax=Oryza brachyantha TaxID=4533 RepID=J3LWD9_ORYBR